MSRDWACNDQTCPQLYELRKRAEEAEAELRESFPANVCPHCGHVGDFWFDRTLDREPWEEPAMHYRCEKCGVAVEGANTRIKELEADNAKLRAYKESVENALSLDSCSTESSVMMIQDILHERNRFWKERDQLEADNAKLRAEVEAIEPVIEIMTTYGSGVRLNKALAAYRAGRGALPASVTSK